MGQDRWRVYVICYLVWVILLAVVEGTGREACRTPNARWVAAATDERDRTMRTWFADRARDCPDDTAWYSYSMVALVSLGLLAPFGVLWRLRTRAWYVYTGMFVAALAMSIATMGGIRWLYDWAS